MNSTSTHFVPPRRVGIYEPVHQFGMWGESFKSNIGNGNMNTPSHIIIPNNQKLDNNLVLFCFIVLWISWCKNLLVCFQNSEKVPFLEIIFFSQRILPMAQQELLTCSIKKLPRLDIPIRLTIHKCFSIGFFILFFQRIV